MPVLGIDTLTLLGPLSFAINADRDLTAAHEYMCKKDIACEQIKNEIQAVRAKRKRTVEGTRVLKALRLMLQNLLNQAESSKHFDERLFKEIQTVKLALQKAMEVEI